MTIIAGPKATPAVQRFVLNLNTLLAQTPSVEPARAGTKRRAAREKAQQAGWFERMGSALAKKPKAKPTRQVRRAMSRTAAKSKLAARKKQAMLDSVPGGSAVV